MLDIRVDSRTFVAVSVLNHVYRFLMMCHCMFGHYSVAHEWFHQRLRKFECHSGKFTMPPVKALLRARFWIDLHLISVETSMDPVEATVNK